MSSTFTLPGFAVSGKAGSGKSLFADLLVARLEARGALAQRVSFAYALKREVLTVHGLRKGQRGWRDAMESLSAQRRAEHGEDYWVRQTRQMLAELHADGVTPVIDDLRLLIEMDFLQASHLVCVRLQAPARVRAGRLRMQGLEPAVAFSQSPLECELDNAEFVEVLRNGEDATVDDLRGPAERMCRAALLAPAALALA